MPDNDQTQPTEEQGDMEEQQQVVFEELDQEKAEAEQDVNQEKNSD